MNRPHLEVADIVRAQGEHFIANNRSWIHWAHQKVLRAIANCRTAVLGGHRYQCPSCGHRAIVFHSCRNRHCPKCHEGRGSSALARSSPKRNCSPSATSTSCLPCSHQLCPLILQNKKLLYDLVVPGQHRNSSADCP